MPTTEGRSSSTSEKLRARAVEFRSNYLSIRDNQTDLSLRGHYQQGANFIEHQVAPFIGQWRVWGAGEVWSGRPGSKQVQPMPTYSRSRPGSPVRQYSDPLISQRMDVHPAKDPTRDRPGFSAALPIIFSLSVSPVWRLRQYPFCSLFRHMAGHEFGSKFGVEKVQQSLPLLLHTYVSRQHRQALRTTGMKWCFDCTHNTVRLVGIQLPNITPFAH